MKIIRYQMWKKIAAHLDFQKVFFLLGHAFSEDNLTLLFFLLIEEDFNEDNSLLLLFLLMDEES